MNNSLFDLDKKWILVTGVSGHLGRPILKGLLQSGVNVIGVGRNLKECKELASTVASGEFFPIEGDLLDKDFRKELILRINDLTKILHGIVHAAYSGRVGDLVDATRDDFVMAYDFSVTIPFELTIALRTLLKRKEPKMTSSVVNLASMYGIISPKPKNYLRPEDENPPQYGPSKAAMIQLTKHMAVKLAGEGVRVNAISPGAFPNLSKNSSDFINLLEKNVPMERMGEPEELIGSVIFLLSDASSYVTGTNLVVDGGWTIW